MERDLRVGVVVEGWRELGKSIFAGRMLVVLQG
jgi:hypothetical protein